MKNKDTLMRVAREFKKLGEDVKLERVKKGKDRRMLSDTRLTLAMSRIGNLKDFLVDANIEDEKIK